MTHLNMNTTKTVTDAAGLAARAMLSTVKISQWTAKRTDKKIERAVAAAAGSKGGKHSKTDKYLVTTDEPTWKDVCRAGRAVWNHWREKTLPWQDGGTRLLLGTRYLTFAKKLEELVKEYNEAVAAFVADYENVIDRQAPRLGSDFDRSQYPADIADRFGVAIDYRPVECGNDFRVDIDDEHMTALREARDKVTMAAADRAAREPWQRMQEVVKKMVDTLKQPTKIFRDTLVDNIRDVCAAIPELNIMGDTDLDAITEEIKRELTTLTASSLRDPKWRAEQDSYGARDRSQNARDARTQAADKAADILKRINEVM